MRCSQCGLPLDAHHLIVGPCHAEFWSTVRREVIDQIETTRAKEIEHKTKVEEAEAGVGGERDAPTHPEDGYPPDAFPEKAHGGHQGRALHWLDPRWPPGRPEQWHRDKRLIGTRPTIPNLEPRDLPCPPGPARNEGGSREIPEYEAHENLNQTNPLRTILGAPPTQLRSLFNALGANPARAGRLYAETIAPILLNAVSQTLGCDWSRARQEGCPHKGYCVTCESQESAEQDRPALDRGRHKRPKTSSRNARHTEMYTSKLDD